MATHTSPKIYCCIISLRNFSFISMMLFVELNSFFLRFNLVLKYHDPERVYLLSNICNLGNFLTMILRIGILIRMYVYIGQYAEIIPTSYGYFIYIFFVLIGMTYLAWTAFRYMIFNDLFRLKIFFKKIFCISRDLN